MPIDWSYDAGLHTLFITAKGKLTRDELLEVGEVIARDDSIPVGRKELIDLLALETADFPSTAVGELAEIFRRADTSAQGSQIAMVASADWAYGLSRMYQTYRDDAPSSLQVFRTVAEARTWLELPAE